MAVDTDTSSMSVPEGLSIELGSAQTNAKHLRDAGLTPDQIEQARKQAYARSRGRSLGVDLDSVDDVNSTGEAGHELHYRGHENKEKGQPFARHLKAKDAEVEVERQAQAQRNNAAQTTERIVGGVWKAQSLENAYKAQATLQAMADVTSGDSDDEVAADAIEEFYEEVTNPMYRPGAGVRMNKAAAKVKRAIKAQKSAELEQKEIAEDAQEELEDTVEASEDLRDADEDQQERLREQAEAEDAKVFRSDPIDINKIRYDETPLQKALRELDGQAESTQSSFGDRPDPDLPKEKEEDQSEDDFYGQLMKRSLFHGRI